MRSIIFMGYCKCQAHNYDTKKRVKKSSRDDYGNRCWRTITECAMGPDGVVLMNSTIREDFSLHNGVKKLLVEKFIPHSGIKTLTKAVLPWGARLNICRCNFQIMKPVSDLSLGKTVKISVKIKPKEWTVLPQRWVVERTLSWINDFRRLSKEYEILAASAENMIMISHFATLLNRF